MNDNEPQNIKAKIKNIYNKAINREKDLYRELASYQLHHNARRNIYELVQLIERISDLIQNYIHLCKSIRKIKIADQHQQNVLKIATGKITSLAQLRANYWQNIKWLVPIARQKQPSFLLINLLPVDNPILPLGFEIGDLTIDFKASDSVYGSDAEFALNDKYLAVDLDEIQQTADKYIKLHHCNKRHSLRSNNQPRKVNSLQIKSAAFTPSFQMPSVEQILPSVDYNQKNLSLSVKEKQSLSEPTADRPYANNPNSFYTAISDSKSEKLRLPPTSKAARTSFQNY
ncbi:MAG: hypothetical protein H2069_08605 [Legionella sp.]|nr:hypothetical protein [Legionella sp.]